MLTHCVAVGDGKQLRDGEVVHGNHWSSPDEQVKRDLSMQDARRLVTRHDTHSTPQVSERRDEPIEGEQVGDCAFGERLPV